MTSIYDAIEAVLKAALPADCRIFPVNMPLQLMDQLARETAKLCTYLIFQDRIRQTASGATPVHDITLEISVYGTLADVDSMANDLTTLLVGQEVTAQGWRFYLRPSQAAGRRDVWDPRIAVKREYIQFQGLVIAPES
jgi:hypothetical protein